MAGVAFDVAMQDKELRDGFRRLLLSLQGSELEAALDEIGASNVTETEMRFESETDPSGKKWEAHSEVTIAKRMAARARSKTKGSSTTSASGKTQTERLPILRVSGRLADIAHSVKVSGHKGEVQVGTNVVYGRIQHEGGLAGRGRKVQIPARPFLGVSEEGRKEILLIIEEHLKRA